MRKFYDAHGFSIDNTTLTENISMANETADNTSLESPEESETYLQMLYGLLSEIGFSEVYKKVSPKVVRGVGTHLDQSSQFIQSWNTVIFQTSASLLKAFNVVTYTFMGIVNRILHVLVFLGVLMYLVSCEDDAIDTVFTMIPVLPEKQNEIAERVKRNISQVFIVSLLLSLFRGIITWFYFSVMNLVSDIVHMIERAY